MKPGAALSISDRQFYFLLLTSSSQDAQALADLWQQSFHDFEGLVQVLQDSNDHEVLSVF